MATFGYANVIFYSGNGDGALFQGEIGSSGTLDDGEGNATFEPGDFVNGGLFNPNQEYLGTVVVTGQSWPAFYSVNDDATFVYLTESFDTGLAVLEVDETAIFCFAVGTLIATPVGEVAVEALSIGDLVCTADRRSVPVQWIGRQTLAPLFQRVRLVRVAARALGAGLPLRDLVVTADHALMLDGLMVTAGALVNGSTITEEASLPARVTVYHVETEGHDVILAEAAPAETFIDYAGRRVFDNHAEYIALYGEDRSIAENPAPRITSARMLPAALQARLGTHRAA